MVTLGVLGVVTSVFDSETSMPSGLVLSVILLLGGAGLFYVCRWGPDSDVWRLGQQGVHASPGWGETPMTSEGGSRQFRAPPAEERGASFFSQGCVGSVGPPLWIGRTSSPPPCRRTGLVAAVASAASRSGASKM